MNKKIIYGICLVLILFCTLQSNGQAIDTSFHYVIEHQIENPQVLPKLQWVLEENNDKLSIEDILKGDFHDATFIELSEEGNFEVRTATNYWVNFKLSSTIDSDPLGLAVEYIGDCWPYEYTFMSLESFLIDSSFNITRGYSGFEYASTERDLKELINPSVINIKIRKGETKEVWLKMQKIENCKLSLKLSLNAYEDLLSAQKITRKSFINVLIYGFVISFFILVLFIFLWFKEPIYIWFIVFQLSFLLLRICIDFRNEIYFNLFLESQKLFARIVPIFEAIRYIALLQFGRIFINSRVKFPRVHKLLRYPIIAIPILTALGYVFRMLLNTNYVSLEMAVYLNEGWYFIRKFVLFSISLSIISSLLIFIFSKDKLAKVFAIGFILPVTGNIIRQIHEATTHNPIGIDYDLLVSGGMLATMTLALAYRFRYIILDKKAALEDKLLAEQSNSKQLQLINEASNKFVPQKFLKFLDKKNILEAYLGDFVEKEVTVLFSDIRDYTTLSEGMTPHDTFQFVNDFNKKMGPIITNHSGFINQYLGDGIMAIFPESCDDTITCAVNMQYKLHEDNLLRIKNNQKPISMGIGLHHGSLIMGIIGDDERLDAATISDTVNVSSRIESLNKQFGTSLLVSHEFYTKLKYKNRYHLRYLGQVSVKGKKKNIGIYEWLNPIDEVNTAYKLMTQDKFSQGLILLENGNLIKAKSIFQTILSINPKDKASQFYYDYCEHNSMSMKNELIVHS